MSKGQYKKSQVLMKTSSGYEHMFESITEAASFAKANAWTMSLKMEVFGYFEDKQGNKYYRQDKMKTKNEYKSSEPKITKIMPKYRKKRSTIAKKVVVDGVVYDSVKEAENSLGFKRDTLGQALRKGQTECMKHQIAYYKDFKNKPSVIEEPKQPIVDYKPKKEEKASIIVNSDDPVIKMINERIVKILKDAGVYNEIKKLSEAIQKLSK